MLLFILESEPLAFVSYYLRLLDLDINYFIGFFRLLMFYDRNNSYSKYQFTLLRLQLEFLNIVFSSNPLLRFSIIRSLLI